MSGAAGRRGIKVRKDPGFSLIELLIVVAIILIIAGSAIPNFIRARISANEASAISSCRTVNSAGTTFNIYYGQGYSSNLAQLGPPRTGSASINAADLIDDVLASGVKSGYTFDYLPTAQVGSTYSSYEVHASPSNPHNTGTRYFFTDPNGLICMSISGPAGASDSPIQ